MGSYQSGLRTKLSWSHCGLVLAVVVSMNLWGWDAHSGERVGPFRGRTGRGLLARTILNWADNLTVGMINTTIGAGNVVVALVANPILGREMIEFDFGPGNGQQILIKNGALDPQYNYSLGLFNLGGNLGPVDHEAGHSQQSAIMEPLYLPAVGLSYLAETHAGSFLETWANLEADIVDDYADTILVQAGIGEMVVGSEAVPYLLLNFSLDERTETQDQGVALSKIYEWVKAEIEIPLAQSQNEQGKGIPVGFQLDLVKKTVNVDLTRFNYDQKLYPSFHSVQEYGKIAYEPLLKMLHYTALKWSAQFGVNYLFDPEIEARAGAGFELGVEGYQADSEQFWKAALGVGVSRGLNFEIDVDFFKYLTVYASIEKSWLAHSFQQTQFETGVTNLYRSSRNSLSDTWNALDLSLVYQLRNLTIDGSSQLLHWIKLKAGYRF